MIASFGASAVLLFGVPASKLGQPRNFVGEPGGEKNEQRGYSSWDNKGTSRVGGKAGTAMALKGEPGEDTVRASQGG